MVAKLKAKKKKVAPRVGRKTSTAMLLEEKNVGSETTEWEGLTPHQVKLAMYETIRHLNYFYDKKDSKAWVLEYAKKHMKAAELKALRSVDDADLIAVGRQCRMYCNGAPIKKSQIDEKLRSVFQSKSKQAEAPANPLAKPAVSISPAERLQNKTSDLIAQIESVLDTVGVKAETEWQEFSAYNELQKIAAAAVTAKAVVNYYSPLKAELEELLKKKTADLVEGYSHLKLKDQKVLLKFVSNVVDEAEKYLSSKKAAVSTRKPKVKSSAALVSKLKYAKDSAEFKVTSVDPTKLIGAEKALLFDTKTRTITLLVAQSASGMSVKGTTITGFDTAEKKKVRKPEVSLSEFLKSTRLKVDGAFKKLTTKASAGNGRCNATTILLKVF